MQEQAFKDLDERATRRLEEMFPEIERKLAAHNVINHELGVMVEQDQVLILTDEEERLIRCFRKFKARTARPGVVFKWQTHPEAGVIVPLEGGFLIVDPQDVNIRE